MSLNTEQYVEQCNDYAEQYIEGVKSGYIIVGKYIKKLVEKHERLIEDPKYIYRQDKVNKVFAFFSFLNVEHKNQFTQFSLLPWQAFFIRYTFGLYYSDNPEKRVVREVLLFLARKNGKSCLSAAIQLYGLTLDGVVNPQSMLLAQTAGQASIALNFAKSMVTHSPLLHKRLIPQRSRIVYRDYTKQGFCQVFSSMEPGRLEGTSPSMAILDEIFAWEDNSVYAAIKSGVGARLNPLILLITTAGSKNNGFLSDFLTLQKNILDGNIDDDTSAAFIYQTDVDDDLTDTDNWAKANPSINYINSLEDLKLAFKRAEFSYQDKYTFLTKHLNIFVDAIETWIPEEYITPCFEDFPEGSLHGRDAFIGIDLSKNTDLSSVAIYVPSTDEDPVSYGWTYNWLANMDGNIMRKNGKDLTNWIFDGHITKCETKTIDIELIYNKIIELSQQFNIVSLQYDPYNAPVLVAKLKEYGISCEKFQQSAVRFNGPLKFLEEAIYNKKIKMKNPVLLWMYGNVRLYVDTNGNIKIVKNKQLDAVDGVVALGMAVGGWVGNKFGDELMGIESYLKSII